MTDAARAAFTKQQRILKPAQYKAVFDRRQSQHNAQFGVYVAKNDLSHARLGLVVSKKVSKKAVLRNKIKRHARECFRNQADSLGSHDFVVVAKAPLTKLSSAQMHSALHSLFGQAKQRCKK